jgi:hypothetical protein
MFRDSSICSATAALYVSCVTISSFRFPVRFRFKKFSSLLSALRKKKSTLCHLQTSHRITPHRIHSNSNVSKHPSLYFSCLVSSNRFNLISIPLFWFACWTGSHCLGCCSGGVFGTAYAELFRMTVTVIFDCTAYMGLFFSRTFAQHEIHIFSFRYPASLSFDWSLDVHVGHALSTFSNGWIRF